MSNKEKKTLVLCMRYAGNCNFCPRNKKCDEEIKKKDKVHKALKRKIKR